MISEPTTLLQAHLLGMHPNTSASIQNALFGWRGSFANEQEEKQVFQMRKRRESSIILKETTERDGIRMEDGGDRERGEKQKAFSPKSVSR